MLSPTPTLKHLHDASAHFLTKASAALHNEEEEEGGRGGQQWEEGLKLQPEGGVIVQSVT